MNLREINEVLEVNPEDFDCTVQVGVTRLQLNKHLKGTGLWFPVGNKLVIAVPLLLSDSFYFSLKILAPMHPCVECAPLAHLAPML